MTIRRDQRLGRKRRKQRRLGFVEGLERRTLFSGAPWSLAGDEICVPNPTVVESSGEVFTPEGEGGTAPFHNAAYPADVDADGHATTMDLLLVLDQLISESRGEGEGERETAVYYDVDADGFATTFDLLLVIDELLPSEGESAIVATTTDVDGLLRRAAAASASDDAIIAIVDRGGRILGVHVEDNVIATYAGRPHDLVFAIDGAVAKARSAAFFSSNAAPLPSRTVRFISQSTITQREVESNPNGVVDNLNVLGVAENESTDRLDSPYRGPGFVAPIGVGGHFPPEVAFTPQVDLFAIEHQSRDSVIFAGADGLKTATDPTLPGRFNSQSIPTGVKLEFPESYGHQSGVYPLAQGRGIATLPGGVPLYKTVDAKTELVGGIGVFFPGEFGFATHEQHFVHANNRNGVPQTEHERTNAPLVLESEWIAFAAAGGAPTENAGVGALCQAAPVAGYALPFGRIDLVGITLESFGPHPTRDNRRTGLATLQQVGSQVGRDCAVTGANQPVTSGGALLLDGKPVPEGWLVTPHSSAVGGPTEAEVRQIIQQGLAEAGEVRAAIRLPRGSRTSMVFAVADKSGEVLGLYRMPDATIFSIDVAVAKARNTAYYADAAELQLIDQVDDNNDGAPDVAAGAAFSNRTFRFLAEPRYPTGAENVNPGDFSILNDPHINPQTAENLGAPLAASAYTSVLGYDAFHPATNFREPGTSRNQNGIVFFPGSSPLYSNQILVGGFGVSGDGVDQDDVVTAAGQVGFEAPANLRADQFFVRNVRLPFQKFLRNPKG